MALKLRWLKEFAEAIRKGNILATRAGALTVATLVVAGTFAMTGNQDITGALTVSEDSTFSAGVTADNIHAGYGNFTTDVDIGRNLVVTESVSSAAVTGTIVKGTSQVYAGTAWPGGCPDIADSIASVYTCGAQVNGAVTVITPLLTATVATATTSLYPAKAGADPGTCSESDIFYNTVEHKPKFCTDTDTWTAGSDLPIGIGALSAACVQGTFHFRNPTKTLYFCAATDTYEPVADWAN